MLDIGWTEMLVIAVLALIIIGPKDLPGALRTVGQWVRKARMLAREFQSGVDDMIRESELDEARKTLEATKRSNLGKTIRDQVDPDGELAKEARSVEDSARSAAQLEAPATAAKTPDKGTSGPEAEAKAGADAGVSGPSAEGAQTAAGEAPEPAGKARVVHHPAKVAPGNSVRPPKDEPSEAADLAEDRTKASGSAG